MLFIILLKKVQNKVLVLTERFKYNKFDIIDRGIYFVKPLKYNDSQFLLHGIYQTKGNF